MPPKTGHYGYMGNVPMWFPAEQTCKYGEQTYRGRVFYVFSSRQQKKSTVEQCENNLQRLTRDDILKEQQAKLKKERGPELDFFDLHTGETGYVNVGVTVVAVLHQQAVIELEHREPNYMMGSSGVMERGEPTVSSVRVLLVNYPMTDLVDGKGIHLQGTFHVKGTQQLRTTEGSKTLFAIEPLEPQQNPEKSEPHKKHKHTELAHSGND